MELSNEFEVPVPIEQAWAILTDLERIAPCLPGAQLQEVEGEVYRGIVKIKVGPITAQYKGQAIMVEKDDVNHVALLEATGRDTKGAGNASANIKAELTDRGDHTHVSVLTDLTVTGKVAQFGRGVLGDVSAKLLTQFVGNLEATVLADELVEEAVELEILAESTDDPAVAAAATVLSEAALDAADMIESAIPHPDVAGVDIPVVRRIDAPEAEPIDLLDAAGSSTFKRLVPLVGVAVAVAVAVAVVVFVGLRRRRRS